MLALGAKGVMLGRAPAFALAASGQAGIENMLDIFANEMRVAMTLTGVPSIARIDRRFLPEMAVRLHAAPGFNGSPGLTGLAF